MANIAEVKDIVLNEIDRQWSQAKQSEDQRATLSNFIVLIAVAAQGYIIDKDFPKRALVVAVVLMCLGLFGVVATAKYYERFRMSMTRVGRLREKLDGLFPDLKLDVTEALADRRHHSRYPYLSAVRLHLLWRAIMGSIFALGAYDLYVILEYGH